LLTYDDGKGVHPEEYKYEGHQKRKARLGKMTNKEEKEIVMMTKI
jgi:hypothetical protein